MKILVTGAKGQLGTDLASYLSKSNIVIGTGTRELDISKIDETLESVKDIKPDIIINCAAYTKVDDCERDIDTAYKINALGPRNLAVAALEAKCRILHISTDFVFDGRKKVPYTEFDNTNPLSTYGKSKLAGENFIREICPRNYILRTAWLYGKSGESFVKTILRLSQTMDSIKVVDDQFGSPTYTMDLVKIIHMLIDTEAYGVYHASGGGSCSWNEFAQKVFTLSGKNVDIMPISSEELNRPAKRPKYSVLKNYMLELQFGYDTRHWEDALEEFINSMA